MASYQDPIQVISQLAFNPNLLKTDLLLYGDRTMVMTDIEYMMVTVGFSKKFSRFFLESYKQLLFDSITGYNSVETPKKIMESYRDVQKIQRQFSKNIEKYRNMDGF